MANNIGIKMSTAGGGVTVYDYQPGNCTRYIVQVTDLPPDNPAGFNGMMTVLNMPRAGSVPITHYAPYASYISEKTGLGTSDAEALRVLLVHHCGG